MSEPYDHKPRPAFRFRRLEANCPECMFRVADNNGALVLRQMEAHADKNPGHTIKVTSGEYSHPEDLEESNGE